MKKRIIFITMFILVAIMAFAQLNTNAQFVKKNIPVAYTNIKRHAVEKWATDQEMIVYTINQQANGLCSIMGNFKAIDANKTTRTIFINLLTKWSYLMQGTPTEAQQTTFYAQLIKNMFKLDEDWGMVNYEMTNQLKALGSY